MTRQYKNDWFTPNIPYFEGLLDKDKIKNVLEIGSYEGLSTNYILDNYPEAIITCIDSWEGGFEHAEANIDMNSVYDRFLSNTKEHGSRIEILKGNSADQLIKINDRRNLYDFVYVDGGHTAIDVLQDLILSFPLLKVGGIMAMDDYQWGLDNEPSHKIPHHAIKMFALAYKEKTQILAVSNQFWIKKING